MSPSLNPSAAPLLKPSSNPLSNASSNPFSNPSSLPWPAHRLAPITAGLLLATLVGCSSTPLGDPLGTETGLKSSGATLLKGTEVRSVLGKPQRYRWTTAAGASGFTQVAPNGRIRTYWESDAVNGRIRFTDDGYCTRYEGVRDNREDCYRMYRISPTQYRIFRGDGVYSGQIELER